MRPKLLDLFCGAGGCSVGYHRAGFDVTGVDLEGHPDYPFEMSEGDALTVLADGDFLDTFDVIHASPPCQGYTTMSNKHPGTKAEWPQLLEPVRDALIAWGGIYVIENVLGARRDMRKPFTLHGGMFGLGVHRPRLFESNIHIATVNAPQVKNPLGVYGKLDGRRIWTRTDGTELRAPRTLEQGQAVMGIDWMNWDDLREAIPPAYTEYIGRQIIGHLGEAVA